MEKYNLNFIQSENDLIGNFSILNIKKDIFTIIKKNSSNISNSETIDIKDFFSNSMKVNDVYRYNVKINSTYPKLILHSKSDEHFLHSNFADKNILNLKHKNSIVLLLESPHKDEYKLIDNKYKPIAPAQGVTGKNIEKYICMILNEVLSNNKYSIALPQNDLFNFIICNPVQYQTSLSYYLKDNFNKNLRDEIWNKIFIPEKVKSDFKNRLSSYNPQLIINSCTKNCKSKVDEFIKTNYPNTNYVKTVHPSSWNFFSIK